MVNSTKMVLGGIIRTMPWCISEAIFPRFYSVSTQVSVADIGLALATLMLLPPYKVVILFKVGCNKRLISKGTPVPCCTSTRA